MRYLSLVHKYGFYGDHLLGRVEQEAIWQLRKIRGEEEKSGCAKDLVS